ncbi:hypothetical protein [Pararhizobium sp.]|uniref:hypothetical protein n=1 Tax=Pararhizobium sp. TaxID=1977563 RepID=UPI003D14B849
MNFKSAFIAFASLAAVATTVSPASAGGLSLNLFNGKGNGIANGGIVIAPAVGVGDVLSGNNVLNGVLNGSGNGILNGILSGNNTGILGLGILSGDGGKKRR